MDIKEIKEAIKGDLIEVKNDLNTIVEKVKGEGKKDLSDLQVAMNGEIKSAIEKADAIAVKFDEVDKQMKAWEADQKRTQLELKENPKSFDSRLQEAVDENHDEVQRFIKGEKKTLNLELKAVAAVGTGNITGTTNWGGANEGKFVMNQNTLTHVRSLIPTRPFGAATDYYFMYENGAGEGSIAATAEAGATAATTQATGLKPQFDVDLVEASVKFEIIAGWMLMSRKAMKNIPGFIGFLQSRLPERLLDAEDAYLLYGTGTSPQIKGILASGNFVASTSTISNKLVEKIIDDITLLEDTYKRTANGIVLRPAQYNSMFKNKAAGSGEYDLPFGVTFLNQQLSILGVPVTKTTALTDPDYVVGDFVNGAELLIQEAINIQFFEQDSTNVRTNQVTVRIEETVAFPVYGANFFVKGTSATS